MNLKKLIIFLVFVSFMGTSAASEQGERKGGRFKKAMEALELNQEQLEAIREFRKGQKGQKAASYKKVKELREQMKKAFIEDASESELKRVHNELEAAHAEMTSKRLEKLIFMKKTLNKEQREKFMEMKKNHTGRKHK